MCVCVSVCVREEMVLLSAALPLTHLAPGPGCGTPAWWMAPGEKALSTVRLPSARPEVGAYITAWGLGYIMWPPTVGRHR